MKTLCQIIIFAKAPVPGFAKTRLANSIGNEMAARLASRMLVETVQQAFQAGLGPVEVCCAPNEQHEVFQQIQQNFGVVLSQQGSGDLGQRMALAFERSLDRYSQVLLIGTDAPGLLACHLQHAAELLDSHPAVFAPAYDGGYVLVGLSKRMPMLFDNMMWSNSSVMDETRRRLNASKQHYAELKYFFDIDVIDDLIHVPNEWLTEIHQ